MLTTVRARVCRVGEWAVFRTKQHGLVMQMGDGYMKAPLQKKNMFKLNISGNTPCLVRSRCDIKTNAKAQATTAVCEP